MVYQNPWVYT